jgi:hypothetical protein
MEVNFKIESCSGYLRIVPSAKYGWPNQVCIVFSHRGCDFHNYRRIENNHIVWDHRDDKSLPLGLINICNKLFKLKAFW